jgi:hypothetical protein
MNIFKLVGLVIKDLRIRAIGLQDDVADKS